MNRTTLASPAFHRLLRFCLAIAIWAAVAIPCSSQDAIIKNGSFENWTNGVPDSWTVGVGAKRNPSPQSKIRQADIGGLQLSGDSSTKAWQIVSQPLNVKTGKTYQLNFEAMSTGVKREPGQFNSCYVGVFFKDKQGKVVGQVVNDIVKNEYQNSSVFFDVPKNATQSEVLIFLAKTGVLSVKHVDVKDVDPKESFDILVKDMDRNYSYFEHKKIDWKALSNKYRDRATTVSDNPEKFAIVVNEMLLELKDMHVWVIHKGKQLKGSAIPWEKNFDFNSIIPTLKEKKIVQRVCLTGKTPDGFGYVLIESMSGINDRKFEQVASNISSLFDTPGIIFDLRANGGGNEKVGQLIAGMFCEQEHLYAKQKIRSGPNHSDFTKSFERSLAPWRFGKNKKAYTKPIVCLLGPGAVSSGEGFALMMKAIPHCTTVGLPTRGSSGNPAPIKLPNGVEVWYSRWVAMDADGNPFEGKGIQPDVLIKHSGNGDPAFEKAVELLNRKD